LMRKAIILLILLALASSGNGHPREAQGIVTRIISGVAFEVSGLGCVELADVKGVPAESRAGLNAREFSRDNLASTQVFLDIDNKTGKAASGCWCCVVYKAYSNGTPNLNANYNKIFADSDFGMISDDSSNEFDPATW
jgi:hypothetical protein